MQAVKKNIVLAVTGSIAAFKAVELLRELQKRNHEVRVILTPAAAEFVGPLTFASLSGFPVLQEFWSESKTGIGHIALADWADCFVVAPCTADTLAKIAIGIADSPVTATALATKAPIVVAPAMNVNMWKNQITQEHVAQLQARKVTMVKPEQGELACGWIGEGRLAEVVTIADYIEAAMTPKILVGKKILITAGPTSEEIDPVRFISNKSSGAMGLALAKAAWSLGAAVTVVHGSIKKSVPSYIKSISVSSTDEMLKALQQCMTENVFDALFMAAAVADFKLQKINSEKIKKENCSTQIVLELVKTIDILKTVQSYKRNTKFIGFKLETGTADALILSATKSLRDKQLDFVVANRAEESLNRETSKLYLVNGNGAVEASDNCTKEELAYWLFQRILL